MLDPKSIETLVGFGGINGLLRGLGTNADARHWPYYESTTKTQGANSSESSRKPDLGAGEGATQRHDLQNIGASEYSDDSVHVIASTQPNELPSENEKSPFFATLEDRRQIYGDVATHVDCIEGQSFGKRFLLRFPPAYSDSLVVDPAVNRCCHLIISGIFPRLWSFSER
jgi:hypothetical protein